jgi:hypothetical protein
MKINKEFDCVKMKNDIQRKLYERRKNMTHEEEMQDMNNVLNNSRSVSAEWWRKVDKSAASTLSPAVQERHLS